MKKSDIMTIVLIATVSVVIAYIIGNSIFGGITEQSVKVKTIDAITSDVEEPSKEVFNDTSINPAVEVQVDGTPD